MRLGLGLGLGLGVGAWMKPKMRVMLHVIPSFSRMRAAAMPSHVPG